MALVQKRPDDYVVRNRSNADVRGSGTVTVWTLSGPDAEEAVGLMFHSYQQAVAEGHTRAEARGVSLWQETDPLTGAGELVASFRK